MLKQTLLIIVLLSIVTAQDLIIGQVFDENNKPLSYALISDAFKQNWVVSDELGCFSILSGHQFGDSLLVSRYGYYQGTILIDNSQYYVIKLTPKIIKGESVIVKGETSLFPKQIAQTYSSTAFSTNFSDLFNQIPGINIRSYGGRAGNAAISTNGSKVENTKVIFANVDLTSVQNGQTDISRIPAALMQQVTVANSPSILFGSGAVDAAFRINPIDKRTSVTAKHGSYNFNSIDANFSKAFGKLAVAATIGHSSDDGNFKYKLNGDEYTRKNNKFSQIYYLLNGKYNINSRSNFELFILDTKQERGAAGSTAWLTPYASHDDELLTISAMYNLLHKNGYTKIRFNYLMSNDKYIDNDPLWPTKSKHTIYTNAVIIDHTQYLWKNISANLQYEFKAETINSSDVGDRNRVTNSISSEVSLPLLFNFELVSALRLDKIDDVENHITESAKLVYYGINQTTIEYSIASGFRNPSFNEMYWNPGGNPDLLPEQSWYNSIKISKHISGNSWNNIYVYLSDRHSDQLIQWIPIDETYFNWEPRNIAKSRRSNATIGLQYQISTIPIRLSSHYTYQQTKDIDMDSPLLYAPEYIAYASIRYVNHRFQLGFNAHYTGGRIIAYGEPDLTLPEHWLASMICKYNIDIFEHNISATLEMNNLFNKEYVVMDGYPEPGRTVNLGFTFTL